MSLSAEVSDERQTKFQQVIVKCVLQLMLIQTVNDLLAKDVVYCAYPALHLMELMGCLGKSFHFAKKFNMNNDLRMALFRFGKVDFLGLTLFYINSSSNRIHEAAS